MGGREEFMPLVFAIEAEEEGGSRELPVKETVQQLFIGKSLAIPIFLLPLQSFRKESP